MDTTTLARARELYLAGGLPPADAVPCVCTADRDAHTGKSGAGKCAATGCHRYRPDPIVQLAARAAAGAEATFHQDLREHSRRSRARMKRKTSISVRPSDVGACRRSVYYRETPPEGFEAAITNMGAAWMGGLIHDEFMRRRRVLYPWRMYPDHQRGLAINLPGSDRPYRYDEYDPITGRLISIKTAGSWRWDKTGQEGADPKWFDADHLYAWALREQGYPVDDIEVLVIERADGKSERFIEPYDEARAQRVLRELGALATSLELGIVPPRDEPGPTSSGLCRNCFARNDCWSIPAAERRGVSPEFLTIVDPRREEDEFIEELAAALVEAREEKKAAEKREDELKALLAGDLELRPYGDYEPVPGRNVRKQWEDWAGRVGSVFHLPDAQRPAELPEVPVNETKYVTWKRLRKATRDRLAKERKAAEAAATEAAAMADAVEELEQAS